MLIFNDVELCEKLGLMPPKASIVFAASCAERSCRLCLVKNEYEKLRSAMDLLWEYAISDNGVPQQKHLINCLVEEVEKLVEMDDSNCDVMYPMTENAICAVFYALKSSIESPSKNAAWVALQNYEAVDFFAHNFFDIGFSQKGAERHILGVRQVQEELRRQNEDLRKINENAGTAESFSAVARLLQSQSRNSPVVTQEEFEFLRDRLLGLRKP